MPEPLDASAFLRAAGVDAAVFELCPDYRALLVVVEGIGHGVGNDIGNGMGDGPVGAGDAGGNVVRDAEAFAAGLLREGPVEDIGHVAAWRAAYRRFGAKPQRTRHSLEALLRRADGGLPRVNPLTDVYNAVSVRRLIPIGGEDLTRYAGPPRLIRARGDEPFDTVAGGTEVVEHPDPGEVIWCDDAGVTCRRWNWRQARRTQLREGTTSALFILDALDPVTDEELSAAADDLVEGLSRLGRAVRSERRLLTPAG